MKRRNFVFGSGGIFGLSFLPKSWGGVDLNDFADLLDPENAQETGTLLADFNLSAWKENAGLKKLVASETNINKAVSTVQTALNALKDYPRFGTCYKYFGNNQNELAKELFAVALIETNFNQGQGQEGTQGEKGYFQTHDQSKVDVVKARWGIPSYVTDVNILGVMYYMDEAVTTTTYSLKPPKGVKTTYCDKVSLTPEELTKLCYLVQNKGTLLLEIVDKLYDKNNRPVTFKEIEKFLVDASGITLPKNPTRLAQFPTVSALYLTHDGSDGNYELVGNEFIEKPDYYLYNKKTKIWYYVIAKDAAIGYNYMSVVEKLKSML